MNIKNFWQAVLSQNKAELKKYFNTDVVISWPCSNEKFGLEEYLKANCEYPGKWDGEIERVEEGKELIISVVRVFPQDQSSSYHVVSFLRLKNDKILEMDEYWSTDEEAPKWRKEMMLGKKIYF